MTDALRVVIADDHAPVRSMVREALEADGCEVVGEASDAWAAVAATRAARPQVCLLDVHMPGGGVAAAGEITRALPDTVVVMLTASRDDEDLFSALRAGAAGYLLKGMDPDRLGPTLRGVLAGEAALPRWLAAKVIAEFREPVFPRLRRRSVAAEKLSPREREVMEALSRGGTTEDVARELFLSPTTVRVHVSAVLRKLRVKDRASAFALLRDDERDEPSR